MKKFISIILFIGCVVPLLVAQQSNEEVVSKEIAVVYFSATGTTEKLAKTVAETVGADLIEIEPVHKYTSADLNWHDKKSLTTIECNDPKCRPEIKNSIDISSYNTVILCYPIWWAYAPKIVYTFVESQNWKDKALITLCTSGGSGLGRSGSDLTKYAKDVNFKGGKDFTRYSSSDLKKYIDGLLK